MLQSPQQPHGSSDEYERTRADSQQEVWGNAQVTLRSMPRMGADRASGRSPSPMTSTLTLARNYGAGERCSTPVKLPPWQASRPPTIGSVELAHVRWAPAPRSRRGAVCSQRRSTGKPSSCISCTTLFPPGVSMMRSMKMPGSMPRGMAGSPCRPRSVGTALPCDERGAS